MALGIDEVMFIKQAGMLFVLCALNVFRNHRFAGRISRHHYICTYGGYLVLLFLRYRKDFGCDAYSGYNYFS